MKSIINVYQKKMSGIANLQEESEVSYNLLQTENEGQQMYGIQLVYKNSLVKQIDELLEISESEEKTRDFLTLLYENAIMIDIWKDIVLDMVTKDVL